MECSRDLITLDDTAIARTVNAATKGENIPRLGLKDNVLAINSAFDASGLEGAFEVALYLRTILLDIDGLRGSAAIGVVAVEVPLA